MCPLLSLGLRIRNLLAWGKHLRSAGRPENPQRSRTIAPPTTPIWLLSAKVWSQRKLEKPSTLAQFC